MIIGTTSRGRSLTATATPFFSRAVGCYSIYIGLPQKNWIVVILSDAEEPEELLKQFLGREPEEEAFYAHIGLVKE